VPSTIGKQAKMASKRGGSCSSALVVAELKCLRCLLLAEICMDLLDVSHLLLSDTMAAHHSTS
jgi:hypothetical protein